MTITVDIRGLEPVVEAINKLAQALGANGVETRINESVGQASAQTASIQAPPQQMPGAQYQQNPAAPQGGTYYQAPGMIPTQQNSAPVNYATQGNQIPVGNAQQVPQGGTPPTQQMAPTQGQIPTTAVAQGYTQDQIAVAMTGLVDRGMQPVVMQILGQFGAMSLQQITKEQYPALVTELRKAGANI